MNPTPTKPGHLDEDDRYALAAAAEASARRNRPTWLLAVSFALLVGAGAVFATGFFLRAEAEDSADAEADDARAVGRLIADIRRQRASLEDREDVPLPPVPTLRSELEQLGRRAGLANQVPLPREDENARADREGVIMRRLNYSINDPSLANVMEWVSQAERSIRGLYLDEIKIQPRLNAWQVDLAFARLETRR